MKNLKFIYLFIIGFIMTQCAPVPTLKADDYKGKITGDVTIYINLPFPEAENYKTLLAQGLKNEFEKRGINATIDTTPQTSRPKAGSFTLEVANKYMSVANDKVLSNEINLYDNKQDRKIWQDIEYAKISFQYLMIKTTKMGDKWADKNVAAIIAKLTADGLL